MAPAQSDVLWAQNQIFNRLCVAYLRTEDVSFIRAEDLRKELAIPKQFFSEAMLAFRVGDQLTVEVIESGGDSYLRLGDHGRDNLQIIVTRLGELLES